MSWTVTSAKGELQGLPHSRLRGSRPFSVPSTGEQRLRSFPGKRLPESPELSAPQLAPVRDRRRPCGVGMCPPLCCTFMTPPPSLPFLGEWRPRDPDTLLPDGAGPGNESEPAPG